MKKTAIITISLMLCLLLSTPITYAANWKYITTNSAAEYFFDTESVRYVTPQDETFIEVWLYGIYKNTQSDGAKSFKDKLFLKLDKKAYAIRANNRYDINGVAIRSVTQRGTWIDCIPGTSGEKFYDVIRAYCEANL